MTTKPETELATIPPAPLVVSPDQFTDAIENARTKAAILAEIVEDQNLYTVIQERKHLHVEAWKLIGKGYGFSPQIEWTRPIDSGGWEARCVFTDLAGEQIGSGEAECGTRGDGVWVGRASFAQRSMAQTRAISRAGRNCLDWVVVLAGFDATPYEEMSETEKKDQNQGPGRRLSGTPASPPAADREWGDYCQEHGVNWFKTPKMRGFAHPTRQKDANGKSIFCQAPSPQPQAVEAVEAVEPIVIDDLSDLDDEQHFA